MMNGMKQKRAFPGVKNWEVKKRKLSSGIIAIFRTAFFLGMAYVLLFPLLVMLSRSLRPISDMYNPGIVWIPSGITFENFKFAIDALDYDVSLFFSLRIVLISTVLTVVSCSMAGYALGRYSFKGNKLLLGMAVLTFIVPMQTYIIPLFFQLKYFDFFGIGSLVGLFADNAVTVNVTNSEWAYYLMNGLGVGFHAGVFILLFWMVYGNLPKELEDAARIDGASEARIFLQIMSPNASSAFLVTIVMSMVWNWNEYFFPTILFQSNQFLSTKLSLIRDLAVGAGAAGGVTFSDSLGETVIMYAGACLFILPMLLMYMFAQKFFMQSIENTGITG